MLALEQEVKARSQAFQIVERMAYEYVDRLQPGERFAPAIAASGHFAIGSEAYGNFIGCALHRMSKIGDVDAERRVISIASVAKVAA